MPEELNLFGEMQERPGSRTNVLFRFSSHVEFWGTFKGIAEIAELPPEDYGGAFLEVKVVKWTKPPPFKNREWAQVGTTDPTKWYLSFYDEFGTDRIQVLDA